MAHVWNDFAFLRTKNKVIFLTVVKYSGGTWFLSPIDTIKMRKNENARYRYSTKRHPPHNTLFGLRNPSVLTTRNLQWWFKCEIGRGDKSETQKSKPSNVAPHSYGRTQPTTKRISDTKKKHTHDKMAYIKIYGENVPNKSVKCVFVSSIIANLCVCVSVAHTIK